MEEDLSDSLTDGFKVPSLPRIDSASESGDFDDAPSMDDAENDSSYRRKLSRHSTDLEHAYDLSPPPPAVVDRSAELVAERLFSVDHLNVILKDTAQLQRFTTFLMRYRAHCMPTLVRYLDSQKALKAIQYANALVEQITQQPSWPSKASAASLDPRFQQLSQRALEELVSEALPAYITFNVIDVVTELLNKEIAGKNTPVMRELVHGLAEVYCLSDPTQEGNPIVFASDEFYNTTQYSSGYVIGKACRFLHGPKTDKRAIERMNKAVQEQQEVAEIMVQYRQDGSPFLALVLVSPLKDNRGAVRYFIGARIVVTQLIEGGKTMDSFHQLLNRPLTPTIDPLEHRPTLRALQDFGDQLNDEEKGLVRDNETMRVDSQPSTPRLVHSPTTRRFVGIEERISQDCLRSQYSGHVPGVYQNYILVRPCPSLRIIFTSPSLRIPGLCQSKLEDHIGGPEHVRDSLLEALAQGIGVTAKVSWLTRVSRPSTHLEASTSDDGASIATSDMEIIEGKERWIHCTPLTGSDGKVGVIMIIMTDKQPNLSSMSSTCSAAGPGLIGPVPPRARARSHNGFHSVDRTLERWQPRSSLQSVVAGGSRLYADYMKEITETQKVADSSSKRLRENVDHCSNLGSMATAISVKAVNGRRMAKKVGGTF